MGRSICLGELLLGIEGAARFRHPTDTDQEFADTRVEASRPLLARYNEPQLSVGSAPTSRRSGRAG